MGIPTQKIRMVSKKIDKTSALLSICRFRDGFDKFPVSCFNDEVFGKLLANRMGSVVYGVLSKEGLLDMINREYRTVLKILYENSVQKNKLYTDQVSYIDSIMKGTEVPYALLKGAILCPEYPEGYRTSNDIDILISSKDLDPVSSILFNEGFRQGYLKNGLFREATRVEIVRARMSRVSVSVSRMSPGTGSRSLPSPELRERT